MKTSETHVVIGGGVAGCLSAIMRGRAGYRVVLLERRVAASAGTYPVCTETSNIVSENHSGAEYPFDPRSARDCLDGRIRNQRFFPEAIYGGKTYSRIIASRSMIDAGFDILAQCRRNMEVIREHYARRCREDAASMVFGPPATVCREIDGVEGVRDVAGAFVTPQRGINPVMVAAVLEHELRRCGIDFRQGCTAESITRLADGRYAVACRDVERGPGTLVADQLSLCAAAESFRTAMALNPALVLPPVFLALREIHYVDLPDGCDKTFTCLKLEDEFGGMLSPMNDRCAMVYHPPAAHISVLSLDPRSGEFPAEYRRHLDRGHPEAHMRGAWALDRLRGFYPELERSEIVGTYLKVAVNTVPDSRIRRNPGVYRVLPSCTMTVLPKWTMCVTNARQELSMALERSVAAGNMGPDEAAHRLAAAADRPCEAPESWAAGPEAVTADAARHAANMRVPPVLAVPMAGAAAVA